MQWKVPKIGRQVGQNMRFYAFFSIFQKTEKNSILCRKICPLEIVKLIIFFDIRH